MEFVGDLYFFHKKFAMIHGKLPSIDKRPIDLYHLRQCVQLRGGFREVCRGKLWAQIGRELGYSGKIMTSLSSSLKSVYNRLLFPFDEFVEKSGGEMKARKLLEQENRASLLDKDFLSYTDSLTLLPGETTSRVRLNRESLRVDREIETEDESRPPSKKIKLSKTSSEPIVNGGVFKQSAILNISCSSAPIIRSKEERANSALISVEDDSNPSPRWHYGMTELSQSIFIHKDSPSYNLRQFQNKANVFSERYFENKNPSDSDVEREYWRIFNDPGTSVEVEYGANLSASIHGSGFPQIEQAPYNTYSKDQWNLNALPFCNNSFFRYVDADIPYLVKPSIFVGMVFSTQSWNFSDFFSGIATYHHYGSTKTWYSIPEQDFDKFHALLREEIGPEAADTSPSLLLEPNVVISPQTLLSKGIQCYAIDQRPGQIVLSFPKAHTCHFNHGFNLAESVNVAMFQDWLRYGQECAELYAKYKIPLPFSLDQLVFSLTKENISSELLPSYVEAMCKKERLQRQSIRSKFSLPESLEPTDNCMCSVTHAYSYLSHVVDADGKNWSLESFLKAPFTNGRLILEFSDEDLDTFQRTISRQSLAPSQWTLRYQEMMSKNPRPFLKTLQDMLVEGERIAGQVPAVATLRKFVAEANELVDKISRLLSNSEKQEDAERFQELLEVAQSAAFTSPEINLLQGRAKEIQRFSNKAERLLSGPGVSGKDYEALLEQGNSLNISLPVLDVLRNEFKRVQWIEASDDEGRLNLDSVNNRIAEGLKLGISHDNQLIQNLNIMRDLGVQLEIRVKKALSDPNLQYSDLQSIMMQTKTIPIKKSSLKKLQSLHETHLHLLQSLEDLIDQSKAPTIEQRPKYSTALAIMADAKLLNTNPKLPEVERNVRFVGEWLRHGKRLFGKGNAPLHIVGLHLTNISKRNDACLRVPGEGNESTGGKKRTYCFCHSSDTKPQMIECRICQEHYHRKCLRLQRTKATLLTFVCPICDGSMEIPRDSIRPTLGELEEWIKDADSLLFQPDELKSARHVVDRARTFRAHLERVLAEDDRSSTDPDRLDRLRAYLCSLEGADVIVSNEHLAYLRKEIDHLISLARAPSKTDKTPNTPTSSVSISSPISLHASPDAARRGSSSTAATSRSGLDSASPDKPVEIGTPGPTPKETPPTKVRRKSGPKPGMKRAKRGDGNFGSPFEKHSGTELQYDRTSNFDSAEGNGVSEGLSSNEPAREEVGSSETSELTSTEGSKESPSISSSASR